ncbi:MAG: ArsR family transcriptional regulator [Bacteroidetes bacterium]|nr:MAG: ArsR family transcriptional regulator [Bacteroidota bacterium]
MKRNRNQNTCVRVCRDEKQIARCKSEMSRLDGHLSDFAQILQLAGNEVRMRILLLLQSETRLCVCDLSEILEMKIPAVSQHLRKLRDAGLLLSSKEGTTIYYFINPTYRAVLKDLLHPVTAGKVLHD